VFSLILISGVVAVAHNVFVTLVVGALVVASLIVHWMHFWAASPRLAWWDTLSAFMSCGLLAVVVLIQVFREGPITIHRIQGAIVVYLLLGVMFAFAFQLIAMQEPNAFNFAVSPTVAPGIDPRGRFLYFSFTTLTTVGYGDVTAADPTARSLAMLEAVTGQLFPAILIARLVSMELFYRQARAQAQLPKHTIDEDDE
jgi:hypothetical protein